MVRLAIVLLLTAGLAGCKGGAEGKAALPPATGAGAPPMPVIPVGEAPGAPAQPVAASAGKTTGTLYPHAEAQLAPSASGVIDAINVDEGSQVKKGDVLFKLDARDAQLRRDQAGAALNSARVAERAAKVELDRARPMVDASAMNRSQWDAIQARHDAAVAGVQQAQVAVNMAAKAVADCAVRSPIDGVVTAKLKNVGEMATMMPPTIVLVVQQQATLDLRFRLPESALVTVKPGASLTARFDSLGVNRAAKVVRLNPTVDMRSRTVEAVAELDNADGALRPGLLAEIQLGATP